MMAISDERILHACRDTKRGLEKNIALSDEELSQIPEKIKSSDIYFDPEKNNFLFVNKKKSSYEKFVFQQNYDTKMNGEKHTKMIQFITASHTKTIETLWIKIN